VVDAAQNVPLGERVEKMSGAVAGAAAPSEEIDQQIAEVDGVCERPSLESPTFRFQETTALLGPGQDNIADADPTEAASRIFVAGDKVSRPPAPLGNRDLDSVEDALTGRG